jgi:hypothetical protein
MCCVSPLLSAIATPHAAPCCRAGLLAVGEYDGAGAYGGCFIVPTSLSEALGPMLAQSIAPPSHLGQVPPHPQPCADDAILTRCTISVLRSTERSIKLSRAIFVDSVLVVVSWPRGGGHWGAVSIAALGPSDAPRSSAGEAVDMVNNHELGCQWK